MDKQFPSYDVWWLFPYVSFLSIIIYVFCYILKMVKRRAKYNAILPGYKIAWYDVMAILKQLRQHEKLSFQSSALQVIAGGAKIFQKDMLGCGWIIYHPVVVPGKAEAVEEVLKNDAMQGKDFLYKFIMPAFGNGLVTSSGEKWKCHRRLLNPCFHSEILKDFIPIFDARARKLVNQLQKGSDEEIRLLYKPLFNCSLDIACATNMGLEGKETKTFVDAWESIRNLSMERILNWWMWPNFIYRFTKSFKKYNNSLQILNDFTDDVFQRKKKECIRRNTEENVKKRKSLLTCLLESRMQFGSISEEDIKDEVNTFIAAATDTTALTLTYALYFIGQDKNIQTNVLVEVDRIFGEDKERPVENEDLIEMKYVECVLKETIRLFPPIPLVSRTVVKNTNICGYSLPEGASCLICPYILHRDPEVFPNPEKFDPTRFFPENSLNRHPFAYIPFSAGPRSCIGQKTAMMVVKTVLSNVLRHFTVESLDERDSLIFGLQITLEPRNPLRFRLKRRI